MNTAKQLVLLLVTLSLLVGTGWHFSHHKIKFTLDNETLSTTADTIITNLSVKQFNEQGILINVLTTPFMEHIPKGDVHLLQNPHIVVAQDDAPSWDIRSLKAKAFDGGSRITFTDQVVVHQNQGNKTEESTLKTEEVTYYPKEKKATSKLLVTYERPGNLIQSKGMNAFLDEKRIELLHQARGHYDPAKG